MQVDIKFQVSTEEYLEEEIILGEPSQAYFPSLTDYLSLFTFIDLLGEICKRPYENTDLFTLQADFVLSKHTSQVFSKRILKD